MILRDAPLVARCALALASACLLACGNSSAGSSPDAGGGSDASGPPPIGDAGAGSDGAGSDGGGDAGAGDGATVWSPLRIGAGGFVTGIDIAPDGTKVVRTDTYGAYVATSSGWKQLVTATSLPASYAALGNNAGVYEIRIAPSSTSRLYMAYLGLVFRSDDGGSTFSQTAFAEVTADANDAYRTNGGKMAVDPANPDVVYFGTPSNGLWSTTDGGSSWQAVSGITEATSVGYSGIAFDASSGTTAGRTKTIYVPSWNNGVWVSTNAGASWARTSGGPTTVNNAVVASDGAYYAADGTAAWQLAGGVWHNLNADRGWHTLAVDPTNPARIVVMDGGGNVNQSLDRGATWLGTYNTYEPSPMITRVATDIPWLAWTNEYYMSSGNLAFDPSGGDLYFSEGIGVWRTTLPTTFTPFAWTSQSAGIEQLVANTVAAPPSGQPVVSSWDRALFYVADPDVFPSKHGVSNADAIVAGWDVDYAAATPTFMAALVDWYGVEQSATSNDGGQTWTPFASYPSWPSAPVGGCLAVSTPTNFVWLPAGQAPYATKDGGHTWQAFTLPGEGNLTSVFGAYYLHRHVLAADRATSGTFYLYDSAKGLYRSTDGGTTWSLSHAGELVPYDNFNATLKSVPGQAGHLFFTAGPLSGATPTGAFLRSTDGGATWAPVANVLEVVAFGFGKVAAGATYPTIYVAGYVGGTYGIWRSTDEAQTWTNIGTWPNGSLDQMTTLDGDKNTFGTVYAGFSGSGYAYGKLD